MIIEISKDIDRYRETVIMGLTAKQFLFSAVSIAAGGGVVLALYQSIGLSGSVYVAVPIVAPIALQGFYSFNGMSFIEMMRRKLQMAFFNRPLTYASTENEELLWECRNSLVEELEKSAQEKRSIKDSVKETKKRKGR